MLSILIFRFTANVCFHCWWDWFQNHASAEEFLKLKYTLSNDEYQDHLARLIIGR